MVTEQTFSTTDDNRQLETFVSFNADNALTLSASNASGRVDVSTDPSLQTGTLRVAAVRTDGSEFEDEDHHLSVRVEGNTISVHPDWQFASGVSGLARRIRDQLQHGFRAEDWNLSRLRLSPELDFHIMVTLPDALAEGSQVKIRTASGAVNASNFSAQSSIVTASGDVDARNLTGITAIHTASGDVEATNINESLEVNTASGDIRIAGGDAWLAVRSASGDVVINGTELRNARLTTVSGDVSIAAVLNNSANYGLETVSGDIDLTATFPANDFGATLGFGTLSGTSDVTSDWEKRKRREWTIGTDVPVATINIKTVSGDLVARGHLDSSVQARSLEMPISAREEDVSADDFKQEMKEFGREMKHFGKEMQRMGHDVPPVPPTPPTPPQGASPEAAPGPAQGDTHERNGSHIFTAGPSGRDYRRDETPPSQETEPVSPPTPFRDEPGQQDGAEATSTQDTANIEPPETQPATGETLADTRDERLRILEALEKGEIDIDDAMARLESNKDQPSS